MWPTMWLLKYWVCLTLQDNAKHACVQNSLDLNYQLFALFSLIDKYVTFGSTIMLFIYMTYTWCTYILNHTAAAKNVLVSPHSLPPCQDFFFSMAERNFRDKKYSTMELIICQCAIFTDSFHSLYSVVKYTEGIPVIWKFHLLLFKIKV